MAAGVDVGDDRLARPVAVRVDDVAPVTVGEQLRVVARIPRGLGAVLLDPRTVPVRVLAPLGGTGNVVEMHGQNVVFEAAAIVKPCPVASLTQETSAAVVSHV